MSTLSPLGRGSGTHPLAALTKRLGGSALMRGAVVFTLYGVASALLVGRSALADPQHVCPCIGNGDPQIFMWALKWWPYALSHGIDPVFPHVVFSPGGANLAVTTSIPLPSVLSWPLTALLGTVPAYMVLTLLSPAVAGTAMYFLCEHLTRRRLAAFAGGWLFGFSTYEFSQMVGHAHLMLIALLPLAVLVVLLRLEGRLRRWSFVAMIALLFIAQLWTGAEVLATSCTLGLVAFAIGWLAADRPGRRTIVRVALETAGACALAALIVLPYLLDAVGPDRPPPLPGAASSGVDVASLVVPLQVTLIRYAGSVAAKLPPVTEQGSYFGIPLLLAFAAAVWFGRRDRRIAVLAGVSAVALIFSLGRLLRVAGHPHPSVPLPWRIASHVPLAQVAIPARLILYVWFALAMAIAIWLAMPGRLVLVRWALVGLGAVMILPDASSPVLSGYVSSPTLFRTRAYERAFPHGSTVLALPFGSGGNSMLWQAESDFAFRMPEGYLSYVAPRKFASDPTAQPLLASQGGGSDAVSVPALDAFLRRYHVKTILVDALDSAGWGDKVAAAGFRGRLIGDVWVYDVPRQSVTARSRVTHAAVNLGRHATEAGAN